MPRHLSEVPLSWRTIQGLYEAEKNEEAIKVIQEHRDNLIANIKKDLTAQNKWLVVLHASDILELIEWYELS